MKILATATIDGPEAKGNAAVVILEDNTFELQLTDFWVAPGAPDVQIVFSKNADGQVDYQTMRFIANMPAGNFEKNFPIDHLDDFAEMRTLIVYCKQFFAHFGHGTLNFKD